MSFATPQSFDNFIYQLENEVKNTPNSKLKIGFLPTGFKSLAEKLERIEETVKLEGTKNENLLEEEALAEIDKAIVPDKVIQLVLNEDKKIQIGDTVFHITIVGTFSYHVNDAADYQQVYNSFLSNYANFSSKEGEFYYKYGKIGFTDSYSYINNGAVDLDAIVQDLLVSSHSKGVDDPEGKDDYMIQMFTNNYNLTNYRVGGSTGVGQAAWNLGLNNWRTKEFDNTNRVRVNLYSINWGFFKASGFEVCYQKKVPQTVTIHYWWGGSTTITLYHYWTQRTADELAIGIDAFQGHTAFDHFGLMNNYLDIAGQYQQDFVGAATNMVFRGLVNEPADLVKDFIPQIHLFSSTIEIWDQEITDNTILLRLWNEGYGWAKGRFRAMTGWVVNQLAGGASTPRMMLTPGIGNEANKEYMFLYGVNHYLSKKSQHMRLGKISIGLTLSFGGSTNWTPRPSGFTPNAFKIDRAYIFGAVKYNGVWKGVRMYLPG